MHKGTAVSSALEQLPLLFAGILLIAFLYSSVGHAGASGYIAVLSLFSVAPDVIRPTALALNVLVATIATWQFWRAGHLSVQLLWPFAVFSVPLAFIGGLLSLPTHVFKVIVGAVLLLSALQLLTRPPPEVNCTRPPRAAAFTLGAGIGLLSGLTGTGGGIFLTPVLLFKHWAPVRTAGAVSALFILFNSISGLIGNIGSTGTFPVPALTLLFAAGIGGAAGSYMGSHRLQPVAIKRLLALVLLIAGGKLILSA